MTSAGRGTRALLAVLAPGVVPAGSVAARRRQLAEAVPHPTISESWLILAVLGRRMPEAGAARDFSRTARHDGFAAALAEVRRGADNVEIVVGEVLLDVHSTATLGLFTGVQRVARAVGDDWIGRGAVLVGWSPGGRLRRVDPDRWRARRRRGALHGPALVPWGGHYVLPEVVTAPERVTRIQALAEHSGARSLLVGMDAIPLTTAETTGSQMAGAFAKFLAAVARMSVVATISEAAADEYRGWRAMLPAAGIAGPEVVAVPVAEEGLGSGAPDPRVVAVTAGGRRPLVLCVGSHEPRKNHDAVVFAAETLWAEGRDFALVFVGGNAWNSARLLARIDELRAAGRPVATLSGIPDDGLAHAYTAARFTVFPSRNEGFGLPVAESLLAGTPVVTGRFGSTGALAEDGGCLTVDPRDDDDLVDAMRRLLVDDRLLARLRRQARTRSPRPWGTYAAELWQTLMQ
jgi:glycosyltransferase involved in cell wall biosynthesis